MKFPINKILRNEKYMGDALLQETYTTGFLTKKRIKNNGTVPQYYVEGDHEAIIPKELFMQEVTVKAINQILTERDVFLKALQQNIAKAVDFKSGITIEIEA